MRNIKIILFFSTLLIVLSGCLKIPIGDGESIGISSDGITISDKDGKESTIKMDEDNESFSMSNDDGEEWEASYGEDVEIPKEFPTKKFPIPKDLKVVSTQEMSVDDGEQIMVICAYEGDIDELIDLYQSHFEDGGFDDVEKTTMGDDEGRIFGMSAKQDGKIFMVQIMGGTEEDESIVNLMYGDADE